MLLRNDLDGRFALDSLFEVLSRILVGWTKNDSPAAFVAPVRVDGEKPEVEQKFFSCAQCVWLSKKAPASLPSSGQAEGGRYKRRGSLQSW